MNNLKANELKLELKNLKNLNENCDRLRSEMYKEYRVATRGNPDKVAEERVRAIDDAIEMAFSTIQINIRAIEDMLDVLQIDFKNVNEIR